MRIELDCWIDGELEHRTLHHLDRWLVQTAHKVALVGATSETLVFNQQPQSISSKKLGVAAVSWDGAFMLAAYLEVAYGRRWLGKRVVELGAGIGVVGILLAAWGAQATLTDRGVVLPLLQQNVAVNEQSVRERVHVRELEWGAPGFLACADELAKQALDYIIAADCLYVDQDGKSPSVADFLATCHALAGPNTVVLLAFESRSEVLRKEFMRRAKGLFAKVDVLTQEHVPKGFQAAHIELFRLQSKCTIG